MSDAGTYFGARIGAVLGGLLLLIIFLYLAKKHRANRLRAQSGRNDLEASPDSPRAQRQDTLPPPSYPEYATGKLVASTPIFPPPHIDFPADLPFADRMKKAQEIMQELDSLNASAPAGGYPPETAEAKKIMELRRTVAWLMNTPESQETSGPNAQAYPPPPPFPMPAPAYVHEGRTGQ
ncbi:hypothetical protein D9611_000525 [Ephemerocybe angulata]|uniref:Uncharacterized protein n=1 Tax=Ephemerocybe angulata TaxID=980116 RepID=A0A8H5F7G6_9AGAR|nr:hypothetical protein D9611_000525 [Tulosesus angulatus]